MAYSDEVLADAPWGYWRMAEASGTVLADSSGNSRDLTVTGSPTLAQPGPAVESAAILWPAATAYAGTAVATGGVAATVEAWVYLTATPSVDTVVVGRDADDKYLFFRSGKLQWDIYGSTSVSLIAPAQLSLHEWHHVIASVGPAGAKLRVDKVTVTSHSETSSYPSGRPVYVRGGLWPSGSAITIAEPAYYETQLSDVRTDAHYDAMMSGGSTPLSSTLSGSTALTANLTAVGKAQFAATLAASATLTPDLRAIGAPVDLAASLSAQTTLAAALATIPVELAQTDTADRNNGRTRTGIGYATVTYPDPVDDTPFEPIRIMAQSVPVPTLDEGRPV